MGHVKVVDESRSVTYDLIVGIQTMALWNCILDFGKQEMTIDEVTIAMRQPDALNGRKVLLNTYREATEPLATKEETSFFDPLVIIIICRCYTSVETLGNILK